MKKFLLNIFPQIDEATLNVANEALLQHLTLAIMPR